MLKIDFIICIVIQIFFLGMISAESNRNLDALVMIYVLEIYFMQPFILF